MNSAGSFLIRLLLVIGNRQSESTSSPARSALTARSWIAGRLHDSCAGSRISHVSDDGKAKTARKWGFSALHGRFAALYMGLTSMSAGDERPNGRTAGARWRFAPGAMSDRPQCNFMLPRHETGRADRARMRWSLLTLWAAVSKPAATRGHLRGRSSDGRALQSHCRGQGFDSPRLHHFSSRPIGLLVFFGSFPKPACEVWE